MTNRDVLFLNGVRLPTTDYGRHRRWLRMFGLRNKLRKLYPIINELNRINLPRVQKYTDNLWIYTLVRWFPDKLQLADTVTFQLRTLEVVNYYRFVRQFCGYPSKGQRTWSNACAARRLNKYIRNWYTEKHFKQFSFTCPPGVMSRMMYAEFFNQLWHDQWQHEWTYAKNYRIKNARLFRYKKWKFGTSYSLKNRALTYYQNPYKLKRMKGKKKIVLPKNQFNVGFEKNFTLQYYKRLFSSSLWKKKRTIIL